MSVFPTQLPWRRFVSVLRDLGYRPLKSHRRSLRQFFSPTRTPVRSPSTSLTWATRCTRQAFAALCKLQPTPDEFVQPLDKH